MTRRTGHSAAQSILALLAATSLFAGRAGAVVCEEAGAGGFGGGEG